MLSFEELSVTFVTCPSKITSKGLSLHALGEKSKSSQKKEPKLL